MQDTKPQEVHVDVKHLDESGLEISAELTQMNPLPFCLSMTGEQIGLLAFYFPGYDSPCDSLCEAPCFGNFYPASCRLKAPCSPQVHDFTNAEAAFQALKFWHFADRFGKLSGEDAFKLKRSYAGQEDWTYAGFGSNWNAMLAVLESKFTQNPELANRLKETGNSFLLEHNVVEGRDMIWSDNHNGDGTNWLGLQLMLLRDKLLARKTWIWEVVDISTGNITSKDWQSIVSTASAVTRAALLEKH